MNPTPWGPMIERRKPRPADRHETRGTPFPPLASPFPSRLRKRRARVLGSPSLAVDLIAAAVALSCAFLLWLAS